MNFVFIMMNFVLKMLIPDQDPIDESLALNQVLIHMNSASKH